MYNYGIIGNCTTSALISKQASLDWCCLPRFDSASAFAKILDEKGGGSFEILPVGKYTTKQNYVKHTNILKTVFTNKNNKFEIIDYFVRYRKNKTLIKGDKIHRLIKVLKGNPKIKIIYNPKLNYAKGETKLTLLDHTLLAKNKDNKLFLHSNLDLNSILKQQIITLPKKAYFIVSFDEEYHEHNLKIVHEELHKTIAYWHDFVKKGIWPKLYREEVIRSALTLKLLTYDKTGAVIAASTTSLPEVVGDSRNWDYRYCWLRDGSFTINALTRICHDDEATNYMNYLRKVISTKKLQIMYGIDGERKLTEKKLNHLAGYKNSKPVRVGNGAYNQKQIDVTGEVISTIHEFYVHYRYFKNLDKRIWKIVKSLVNYVLKEWKKKDQSIWEFRNRREHFTFSKLMCWEALNKSIEIAKHFKIKYPKKWYLTCEQIRSNIIANSYNEKYGYFSMFTGSKALDATVLLMPYYNFIKANDVRMLNTIKAIEKDLVFGPLVRRYNLPDDFGTQKNAFLICSFWLIDALYLSGQKSKAKKYFKEMTKYSNHLGLYSEGINPKTKQQTGNFPQAYTHVAFINTAVLLNGKGAKRPVCVSKKRG
jgi:alpha,alpha-trehalase